MSDELQFEKYDGPTEVVPRGERRRRKVDHPGWAVARLAVIMAPLTVVLYANASKFDWTEIKTILEFGILAGGFESVRLLKGR